MSSVIEQNVKVVRKVLEEAANKSGKQSSDILLLAVTKTVHPRKIMEAINCGITDIGENKVQELMYKIDMLSSSIKVHFIGSLQTNKVKYLIGNVCLIQSVDNLKLAREISRLSEKAGTVSNILIEVNIGLELAKSGVEEKQLEELLKNISVLPNVKVRGLMTIPPYSPNPEKSRVYFRRMNNLFVDIRDKKIDNITMEYLSMGMSSDFAAAIEEGSNLVRIGSSIFGERYFN